MLIFQIILRSPECGFNTISTFQVFIGLLAPVSPHMGGCWKKMIRSVKLCLYDVLPVRTPFDEMLRNFLMEAMNVIISRPLTFIPLNTYVDEALTPNHFLLGSSNANKPPGNFDSDAPFLRSAWKEVQRITDLFLRDLNVTNKMVSARQTIGNWRRGTCDG